MEFDLPDSLPDRAPAPATAANRPEILTVSQLNQAVARLLERSFPLAWISGEISNFTRAASGHWYFSLKDAGAQVRAVMFRGRAQYVDFAPREGDKIEVRATVSLYAPRGDFQLNVETMRRAGVGNLYEAFLQLKAKLTAEGLFDPARKRELPAFPRTVGIVTSPQAAALRDMITAFRRRAPHVQLVLYPTLVQGDGAGAQIAQAIATASARAECDLLIVGRGGGSLEDLWCFNDERVARAIAASPVPVISGVGHETDFTIADFVADLRAPTPTAAAELAATPRADWLAGLEQHANDLDAALRRQLDNSAQTLDWLARRVQGPEVAIRQHRTRLDALRAQLRHATDAPVIQARFALAQTARRLQHAMPDTRLMRSQLDARNERLAGGFQACRVAASNRLSAMQAQLELLAPQRTLERGYAIVQDEQGRVLRDTSQLKTPQNLNLKLANGSARISVDKLIPDPD
jgi:exodeoxyribonuclease VII large subunit